MRMFLAALALVAGSTPAAAQWLDRPWPGIPRMADGKPNLSAPAPRGPDGKPDLTGIWDAGLIVGRPKPEDLQPWSSTSPASISRNSTASVPITSACQRARGGAVWRRQLEAHPSHADDDRDLNDDLTYRAIHIDGRQLEADPLRAGWDTRSAGGRAIRSSCRAMDTTRRRGPAGMACHIRTSCESSNDTGAPTSEACSWRSTYDDPGVYLKPWGFTTTMNLTADTEMLEAVCERSSDHGPTVRMPRARR